MKTVGLWPHTGKPEALRMADQVALSLQRMGMGLVLEPEAARLMGRREWARPVEEWHHVDVTLVLGGDGALLKAARALAPLQIPILGVNFGHFGFLTEVEVGQADTVLQRLAEGRYEVEARMMLDIQVTRRGRLLASFLALNDAVITRGTFARILSIETRVSGEDVLSFAGDGVIVATPTGSTAYSLSAGGPIVNPTLECLIVTPVCPHALATRSVILAPHERIDIQVGADHEEIMLTVDGQVGLKLRSTDVVSVGRSSHTTRLVRLGDRNFYQVLRSRLGQRAL